MHFLSVVQSAKSSEMSEELVWAHIMFLQETRPELPGRKGGFRAREVNYDELKQNNMPIMAHFSTQHIGFSHQGLKDITTVLLRMPARRSTPLWSLPAKIWRCRLAQAYVPRPAHRRGVRIHDNPPAFNTWKRRLGGFTTQLRSVAASSMRWNQSWACEVRMRSGNRGPPGRD